MDDLTFAKTVVGVRASSRRFMIMGMLFVTIVINYLDRANLSIAAPGITAEFHLTPVRLGMVFSAFGWFYTGMQLPGGWLVDRIRPGVLYPVTIFVWSLATLSMGLVSGLVVLIALRAAVGFTEADSLKITVITSVTNINRVLTITDQVSQGNVSKASKVGKGVGNRATVPATKSADGRMIRMPKIP